MRSDPPEEPGQRIEIVAGVVRSRGSSNTILYAVGRPASAALVAEQAAYFRACGEEVEWKLYAHDPADLSEHLAASGFEPGDRETLMVLELSAHGPPAGPGHVEIRRVSGDDELATYARVTGEAFGTSARVASAAFALRLFGPNADTIASIAYSDGIPAAAGRLELPRGRPFASLWGGGTHPDQRKRGIYRALVAARATLAHERGYRFLTVDARETSRPILEGLGFIAVSAIRGWVLKPR